MAAEKEATKRKAAEQAKQREFEETKRRQGKAHCVQCGKWDAHLAITEDGGWDWWCPNCRQS
jgi:hypothetical protein